MLERVSVLTVQGCGSESCIHVCRVQHEFLIQGFWCGIRAQGSGFRVWGSGIRVQEGVPVLRVQDSG